ncbi:MAG: hypothetical protein E6590_17410 [Clostridiales bacterium]|nr:hypothetical protein [Clostridiales bacterium]
MMNNLALNGNTPHSNSSIKSWNKAVWVINDANIIQLRSPIQEARNLVDDSKASRDDFKQTIHKMLDSACSIDSQALSATFELAKVVAQQLGDQEESKMNDKSKLSVSANTMVQWLLDKNYQCIVYLDEDNEESIVVSMEEYDSKNRREIYRKHKELIRESSDDFYFDIQIIDDENWGSIEISREKILFASIGGEI